MPDVVLTWERFGTFRRARTRFSRVPCIYVLADEDGTILRVGESDDLWQRYVGGTGWVVDAALHGSGKVMFDAEAPTDLATRRRTESALIFRCQSEFCFRCQSEFCVLHRGAAPSLAPEIEQFPDSHVISRSDSQLRAKPLGSVLSR